MNVADKGRLYGEIHRVLRPDGGLALHEILAGPVSPIYLPVPWARRPELNHLCPPEDVRELLEETGFEELTWIDETAPPCAGTRSGSRQYPRNHRRSGSTSCSATTSARCSATRCATSKSAGSPSSRLSLSVPSSALFENHSQQNGLQGPGIVTSSLRRIADDNGSHLGSGGAACASKLGSKMMLLAVFRKRSYSCFSRIVGDIVV